MLCGPVRVGHGGHQHLDFCSCSVERFPADLLISARKTIAVHLKCIEPKDSRCFFVLWPYSDSDEPVL